MSYLPKTDSGLLSWSRNLHERLNALADPLSVGVSPQNVIEYTNAQADYQVKYDAATAPNSRGGATILAKNESRENLIALSRSLAMTIANAQGVTDDQRYDFGLTVRSGESAAVAPPAFSPEIDVRSTRVRTVTLRIHNEEALGRRGRPAGAMGVTIFSAVGQLPPAVDDLEAWKFEMNTSETRVQVVFPSKIPSGSTVWFTASWYNRRGAPSPLTEPVYVNLPGALEQTSAAGSGQLDSVPTRLNLDSDRSLLDTA